MNITKIGNKFKKYGVTVHSAKKYTKIVIFNDIKDVTDPLITTLLLNDNKLVVECLGDAETPGYHQVMTDRQDIVTLLNIYYQYVKSNVKLKDIPLRIQEKVLAYGVATAVYFDDWNAYTVSVSERDGDVLIDGKFFKAGDLELLKDLRLRVNTVTFADCVANNVTGELDGC